MSEKLHNLVVVLVRTRNPLNLGAVARAMSNFGVAQLRAVQPYGKAWREARSAVGAGAVMEGAKQFATLSEAVADCTLVVGTTSVGNRELKHPLRDLLAAAPLLRERMKRGPVAMLFGSEKWGLSNEELSYCHWLLRIPTREEHRSMNLGQAAAVVFYEMGRKGGQGTKADRGDQGVGRGNGAVLEAAGEEKELNAETHRSRSEEKKRRKSLAKRSGKSWPVEDREQAGLKDQRCTEQGTDAKKEAGPEGSSGVQGARSRASAPWSDLVPGPFADMKVVERVGEALLEALVKSGYVGPRSKPLAEEKLRRMLRRFSLQAADAEVFLGMMRKIVEALGR